jgi:hypothetical protein
MPSQVAVSKVNKFFTAKGARVTQRAQSIDNKNCNFVFIMLSLCPLWLKILCDSHSMEKQVFIDMYVLTDKIATQN